ncbi:hypothetical protein OJJOAM_001145 [Cupriavidus sp. H18C1]|uniref:hypothetical protein n=1 Tax=Cupriavidus sp. H18C1 TaxID=3241601 RepID=UPI003BB8FF16
MYRDDIEINDKQYWDLRFETDWDESQGRQQSRYFARVALDHLPSWLVQLARAQRMTICDWGCAEGDGTDVLAGYFGAGSVTGVDFSDAAIRKAASFLPATQIPGGGLGNGGRAIAAVRRRLFVQYPGAFP